MKIVVIVICNRYNSDTDNSYNNGDIIVITEILVITAIIVITVIIVMLKIVTIVTKVISENSDNKYNSDTNK